MEAQTDTTIAHTILTALLDTSLPKKLKKHKATIQGKLSLSDEDMSRLYSLEKICELLKPEDQKASGPDVSPPVRPSLDVYSDQDFQKAMEALFISSGINKKEMDSFDFDFHRYEKAILVTGETKPYKDKLKIAGGKWNAALKGWIFSKNSVMVKK